MSEINFDLLPQVDVPWVPQRKQNMGTMVEDRFYILSEANENDIFLCWDKELQREYAVRPIQPGHLLNGRYYVLTLLITSPMSSVWLAWDLQGKQEVILKISGWRNNFISTSAFEIETFEKMQLKQAQCMDERLEYVVKLLDYFELQGACSRVCLVLEVMHQDLMMYQRLRDDCGLPLYLLRDITWQMLQGLDYLHSCDFIHTDLKPENVLVTECGPGKSVSCPDKQQDCQRIHIKLADFGNAQHVDARRYGRIQPEPYRSLEAIVEADFGKPADIWGLGCIIFELATGSLLFHEDSPESYLARIIEVLGPIPPEISFRGRTTNKYFNNNGELWHIRGLTTIGLKNYLLQMFNWAETQADAFCAFLLPMLEYDPNKRATAAECLNHPWLA